MIDHQSFHPSPPLPGDEVPLFGFDGFLGGLDNTSNLTGEASIYTNFAGHEIMYHVSTLLPYSPKDPQQVRCGQVTCMSHDTACTMQFVCTCVVLQCSLSHLLLIVCPSVSVRLSVCLSVCDCQPLSADRLPLSQRLAAVLLITSGLI